MRAGYYDDPRPDIQALVEPRGARILDIGCGAGALSSALRSAGAARVAGVEIDPVAAAEAKNRLDVVVEGGALDAELPFSAGEFDYLIFGDVLEHLAEPEVALRRYLDFVVPDGRVIVSVPNMRFYSVLLRLIFDRWSYTDSGVRDQTHLRIFTRRSLIRMLEQAGLDVEHVRRNPRLIEDQSEIGRLGAAATRISNATLARVFRDLMAFQYVAVCRRRASTAAGR
jgi:2-polyprenyl-3-methyl-5-hydroxy-6-metoxy-1,4-benzoquinol methylase